MKALTLTTAILAVLSSVALANGPTPATRAGCYDLVIKECNAHSSNPTACAVNGMDDCDEVYPEQRGTRPQSMTLILPGEPGGLGGRSGVGAASN
jgi:hypothetical protein